MFSLNKSAALSDVQSPPAPPHCLPHSARLKKLFLLPAQPPYSNLNTGPGQLEIEKSSPGTLTACSWSRHNSIW